MGPDIENGEHLQLAVPGGTWKAMEMEAGDFGLVSEVVSPGWELEDMIETDSQNLSAYFPQHAGVIARSMREYSRRKSLCQPSRSVATSGALREYSRQ